ncbi:PadR family transcriptional regulator [Dictyobacter sp. S3.2.2.5]|uniref:PadR family transcriptional regulator n=1 Tax=Dictyobacter halimunensis TaxID=3026934 RepID=A0ABQ6FLX7_9CHLR|nr:PadR family transcriptional regulator [Dictyobacter sp. S3.2.2.5]
MARRKVSNLLALAVLSLLTERPMHPYEMSAVMRQRELSSVIKLNQSSLYAVIDALQREQWIMPVETQREGRYPERTIYTTTEAGRAELADWLRSLIRQPATEYTQFAAGLAFLGNLPPDEVVTLLQEYLQHLQPEIDQAKSNLERGSQLGVDRLFLVEDRYALTLLETRSTFVQQLIQEIHDGTLTEIRDGHLQWKIQRQDLALLGSEQTSNETPDDQSQDR